MNRSDFTSPCARTGHERRGWRSGGLPADARKRVGRAPHQWQWLTIVITCLALLSGGVLWGIIVRSWHTPILVSITPPAQPAPTPTAPATEPADIPPPSGFIYGASVADLKNAPRINELGFLWMKGHISWRHSELERGEYNWADLDKALQAATDNHLGLLLRIDQAPEWAHPSNDNPSAPPDAEYMGDWERFLQLVAARAMGRAQAYEIWNEPNLAIEWGGNPPDAAGYARLLRAAYGAIKRGDPNATVVSAGLANTEEQSANAMDDAIFLRRMYEAGAAPYFDVLGYHPHGGPESPDGAQFLKAELQRRIMEEFKDGRKAIWATELAWIAQPPAACSGDVRWDTRIWESVSDDTQARYLVDSFALMRARWPWMQGAFVFNLDFSVAPWYDDCEPMVYESLLDEEGGPREAFTALQEMPKASPRVAAGVSFPSGRLVAGSGDDVWVVVDGMRHWVPDEETFSAAGYSLEEVQTITDDELKRIPLGGPLLSVKSGRYPDNMLVKTTSSDRVYAVQRGLRRAIPNLGTFDANGYSWLNVLQVPDGELAGIPEGTSLPRTPQIAYVCRQDGNDDICIMNADGISQRRLTDDPAADFGPSWKPGEDRLAFVSTRDGNREIYSMNTDGKEVVRLTNTNSDNLVPSYSPDGTQIVFVSNRGGSYQLWTMAEDGSSPAQLTDVAGDITSYGWSLDGTTILFSVEETGGRQAIWMTDADGSEQAHMADPVANGRLLPGGKGAAALFEAGDRMKVVDLYTVDAADSEGSVLAGGASRWSRLPIWSPGGDKVAWTAPDAGRGWSLHVEDSEGNAYTVPIDEPDPHARLTWSPDGNMLALASSADGDWEVYTYILDDIEEEGLQLTRLAEAGGSTRSPAWLK